MHSEVNPSCEDENEIIIIKANVVIRYACCYGRGARGNKCSPGIIITGKYPQLQNNIELKKLEVAK